MSAIVESLFALTKVLSTEYSSQYFVVLLLGERQMHRAESAVSVVPSRGEIGRTS